MMEQHIPESMLKSRLFPSRISLLRLDIRRKNYQPVEKVKISGEIKH